MNRHDLGIVAGLLTVPGMVVLLGLHVTGNITWEMLVFGAAVLAVLPFFVVYGLPLLKDILALSKNAGETELLVFGSGILGFVGLLSAYAGQIEIALGAFALPVLYWFYKLFGAIAEDAGVSPAGLVAEALVKLWNLIYDVLWVLEDVLEALAKLPAWINDADPAAKLIFGGPALAVIGGITWYLTGSIVPIIAAISLPILYFLYKLFDAIAQDMGYTPMGLFALILVKIWNLLYDILWFIRPILEKVAAVIETIAPKLFEDIKQFLGGVGPSRARTQQAAAHGGEHILGHLLVFIFGLGFVQSILQSLESIDIWKRGPPLREGEAYAVDDVIRTYWDRFPGASGEDSLGELYHNELKASFKLWRRGWLAEYMADAYTQGEGEKIMFLVVARLGLIADLAYDLMNTVTKDRGRPPSTFTGRAFVFFVWIPWFFHYAFLTFAILNERGVFAITEIIFTPTVFLAALCFSKWYADHGLYLPLVGGNTLPSAASFIGVFVISFAMVLEAIAPGFFYNMAFIPVPLPFITINLWPNPIFFGMGGWITGMQTAHLFLLLGLAGVGNLYYGLHEEHVTIDEGIMRLQERVEDIHREVQ